MKELFIMILALLLSGCYDAEDYKDLKVKGYDPAFSDSLSNIVTSNWRTIHIDTAILYLEKAKMFDSTNSSAFSNVAAFYLHKNDLENYKTNYVDMERLFPKNWKSRYELGLLSIYIDNDTSQAYELFRTSLVALDLMAIQMNDDVQIEYLHRRADILHAMGEESTAVNILDSLKTLENVSSKALRDALLDYQFKSMDERLTHIDAANVR